MRKRASDANLQALNILTLFLLVYVWGGVFKFYSLEILPLLIVLFLAITNLINLVVFEYRVSNGFYGRNRQEAADIIKFIKQESKSIDFFDNDGTPKKIIADEDLKEIKQQSLTGQPRLA